MRALGEFVFVAAAEVSEVEVPPSGFSGGLRVIDVSNPKHPFVAGAGLDLPDVGSLPWNAAGLDVDGTSACRVTTKGLYVIDIAMPTVPEVSAFYPFPADLFLCAGGRAMAKGSLVCVAAFCQSDDGSQGRGGLAVYRVRQKPG
jgi:hypothetical protein